MKVVVAGGTGFIGRYIVRALLDAGSEVSVLGRRGESSPIPQLAGANSIKGDVTDPASLRGKLDGADAVVGAVAFPNFPVEVPRKGSTFDNYDRQGTENLLAEAARAGVTKYVYISGAGAEPRSPVVWYRAKGRAEEAIKASGLDHGIVRPSWAYGPEDKALNKFALIARFSPIVPRIGLRRQEIQPIYVGDIASTVVRIFERSAWNKTFEVGGPDVMSMDAVIRTMLKVMGKHRLIVPIPAIVPKLATAPLALLPSPPMSPSGIEFAIQDGLVDIEAMEKELGVHPVPLEEGLSSYLGA